jgi:hypothetical protein
MNPRRAALFHRREEMRLPPRRKKEAAKSGGLDVLIVVPCRCRQQGTQRQP